MVEPIQSCRPQNVQTPVPPATLNSVEQELWMNTFFLFHSSASNDPNSMNYQMAMKGIQNFMTQYPASGAGPTDPYLYGIWEDLTSTNAAHTTSLAGLAQDYTTNGYTAADFNAFTSFTTDTSAHSIWANYEGDVNNMGPSEGGLTPNPQSLTKRAFNDLLGDFPLTAANYSQFLADVKTVQGLLTASTPPLDGCCQFLQDLLNTPLDTTAGTKSTLASLSASTTGVADLTTYLNESQNVNVPAQMQAYLQQMGVMEGWE